MFKRLVFSVCVEAIFLLRKWVWGGRKCINKMGRFSFTLLLTFCNVQIISKLQFTLKWEVMRTCSLHPDSGGDTKHREDSRFSLIQHFTPHHLPQLPPHTRTHTHTPLGVNRPLCSGIWCCQRHRAATFTVATGSFIVHTLLHYHDLRLCFRKCDTLLPSGWFLTKLQ